MARAVWHGVAVVAALVAWHVFSDDFATSVVAASALFIICSTIANSRHGPLATSGDVRHQVLSQLNRENKR